MKRFVLWGLLGLAGLGAVRATGVWTGVDLPVTPLSLGTGFLLGVPGTTLLVLLKLLL